MYPLRTLLLSMMIASALSACSLRRSTLSSSVSVTGAAQEVEPLQRSEYTTMQESSGKAEGTQVLVLWFPVGIQKTRRELTEDAYFDAVGAVEGCDGLLLPRVRSRAVVIPLLLVNFINRRVELEGRCMAIKEDP